MPLPCSERALQFGTYIAHKSAIARRASASSDSISILHRIFSHTFGPGCFSAASCNSQHLLRAVTWKGRSDIRDALSPL